MRRWLITYFGFSRTEIYGILTLLVLVSLLWGSPYVYRTWFNDTGSIAAADMQAIRDFHASRIEAEAVSAQPFAREEEAYTPVHAVEYFEFDPNGLAVVDWKRLGLSERQIRVIKNYETKGGRFRKPADLQKIYSISDADYARLAPYIRIAEPATPARTEREAPVAGGSSRSPRVESVAIVAEKPLLSLDLNRVDSLELQQLPGIGPVFASRIVRFRDRLGGFYDERQLLDVYGFDEERYEGLASQVYADAAAVSQMNINTATYEELSTHPLISFKQANAIVQYRRQHGPFASVGSLLEIVILDEEFLRKIAPYLTTSDDRTTAESNH